MSFFEPKPSKNVNTAGTANPRRSTADDVHAFAYRVFYWKSLAEGHRQLEELKVTSEDLTIYLNNFQSWGYTIHAVLSENP